MAGYRPKSLDELNSLYDKSINAKNEINKKASVFEEKHEKYVPSVSSEPSAEKSREEAASEEITGLVDDFIKSFGTPVAVKKVRPANVAPSTVKPVASPKSAEVKAPVQENAPVQPVAEAVAERPRLIRSNERNDLFEDYKKVMDDDGEEELSRFRKGRKRGKRFFEKKTAPVGENEALVQPEAEESGSQQAVDVNSGEEAETSYENGYGEFQEIAPEIPETLDNIQAVIEKVLGAPVEQVGEAAQAISEATAEEAEEFAEVIVDEAEEVVEAEDFAEIAGILAEEDFEAAEEVLEESEEEIQEESLLQPEEKAEEVIYIPSRVVEEQSVMQTETSLQDEPEEAEYEPADEVDEAEEEQAYEDDEHDDMFYIASDSEAVKQQADDEEYEEEYEDEAFVYETEEKSPAGKNVLLILLFLVLTVATLVSAVKAFSGINSDTALLDKYHLYSADGDYEPAGIKKGDLVVVSHEGIKEGDVFAFKKGDGQYDFAKLDSVLNEDSVVADEGGQKTIVFKSTLRGVFLKSYPVIGTFAALIVSNYFVIAGALLVAAAVLALVIIFAFRKKKEEADYLPDASQEIDETEKSDPEYEGVEGDFRYLIQEDGGDDFDIYRRDDSEDSQEDSLPVYQDEDYKYEPDEYVRN